MCSEHCDLHKLLMNIGMSAIQCQQHNPEVLLEFVCLVGAAEVQAEGRAVAKRKSLLGA